MKLEVVTHCWKYSRLLSYQLASFWRHRPKDNEVKATVFYCNEDGDTAKLLSMVSGPKWDRTTYRVNPIALSRGELCNRAIGRNLAALQSVADWMWFADADYCVTGGFFDQCCETLSWLDGPLYFPQEIRCTLKCHGAELVDRDTMPGSWQRCLSDSDCARLICQRFKVAIGGVQFARGEVLRKSVGDGGPLGYLNRNAGWRVAFTSGNWHPDVEDKRFRRSLPSSAVAIDLPGLVRIRHAERGGPGKVVSL